MHLFLQNNALPGYEIWLVVIVHSWREFQDSSFRKGFLCTGLMMPVKEQSLCLCCFDFCRHTMRSLACFSGKECWHQFVVAATTPPCRAGCMLPRVSLMRGLVLPTKTLQWWKCLFFVTAPTGAAVLVTVDPPSPVCQVDQLRIPKHYRSSCPAVPPFCRELWCGDGAQPCLVLA